VKSADETSVWRKSVFLKTACGNLSYPVSKLSLKATADRRRPGQWRRRYREEIISELWRAAKAKCMAAKATANDVATLTA